MRSMTDRTISVVLQVSKANASKVLLRLTHPGGDVLFDFTQTINAESWRDTFKEAVASALQGKSTTSEGGAQGSSEKQKKKQEMSNGARDGGQNLDASAVFRYFQDFPK